MFKTSFYVTYTEIVTYLQKLCDMVKLILCFGLTDNPPVSVSLQIRFTDHKMRIHTKHFSKQSRGVSLLSSTQGLMISENLCHLESLFIHMYFHMLFYRMYVCTLYYEIVHFLSTRCTNKKINNILNIIEYYI